MIPSRSFMYEARAIWDSTGTIRRATRMIDERSETIRGQLRDATRTAKVIEMMADDAKEPPRTSGSDHRVGRSIGLKFGQGGKVVANARTLVCIQDSDP
jgi:hypothetical protein